MCEDILILGFWRYSLVHMISKISVYLVDTLRVLYACLITPFTSSDEQKMVILNPIEFFLSRGLCGYPDIVRARSRRLGLAAWTGHRYYGRTQSLRIW
jgi:hypothetical protein